MGYATISDLMKFGAPSGAIGDLSPEDMQGQLDSASSTADSYLRLHYPVPLGTPYPAALVEAICRIAAFNLLSVRGYNPEGDAGLLESRSKDAMRYLRDLGSGAASLGATDGAFAVQPTADTGGGVTVVGTSSSRGW